MQGEALMSLNASEASEEIVCEIMAKAFDIGSIVEILSGKFERALDHLMVPVFGFT